MQLTASAMLAGGVAETGAITFKLCDPNGNLVDTLTDTVAGNGTYPTPSGYTPSIAGAYLSSRALSALLISELLFRTASPVFGRTFTGEAAFATTRADHGPDYGRGRGIEFARKSSRRQTLPDRKGGGKKECLA